MNLLQDFNIKVASYQCDNNNKIEIKDLFNYKLNIIDNVLQQCKQQEIELIVFPELFLSNYHINIEDIDLIAITKDSNEINLIKNLCNNYKVSIVLGYCEKLINDNNNNNEKIYYNSCILINYNGEILLNYQKTHLFDPYNTYEKLLYKSGNKLNICNYKIFNTNIIIKIGILICFDSEFSETSRVLTLQNINILCISTALVLNNNNDIIPNCIIPTRANDNNIFVIFSNFIGLYNNNNNNNNNNNLVFCGQSAIIAPNGQKLISANKTDISIISTNLNYNNYKDYIERNNYIKYRRPELYYNITTPNLNELHPNLKINNNYSIITFNASSNSPMPLCALDRMKYVLDIENKIGSYATYDEVLLHEFNEVYYTIGKLLHINNPLNEIALVDSATTAFNRIFCSIQFKKGDIILTSMAEYVSNYLIMLQHVERYDVIIKILPNNDDGTISLMGLKELIQLYNDNIKVVSFPWIPTNGGIINDVIGIGKIISEYNENNTHKILYILDGCQAVGQVAINVIDIKCHALSAAGKKYLRGPRSTGFLYVNENYLKYFNNPITIDLASATWINKNTYEIKNNAKRFEQYEKNMSGFIGLNASIQYLLNDIGEEYAYNKIKEYAIILRNKLSLINNVHIHDLGTDLNRCGIVTFTINGFTAKDIKLKLREWNIFVTITSPSSTLLDATKRNLPDMVRASLQYYNTIDEIDIFCNCINNILLNSI